MSKVSFKSGENLLTARVFLPPGYQAHATHPAVVSTGSWTTVKEQMGGLYAERLAEAGFVTLVFDPTGFGESEGEPRFVEDPEIKVEDIKAAVTYLESRDDVDSDRIGAFGVCAGAGYTLVAASQDPRIKSVATAASWIHDAEAVKLFYGGEEGVNAKLDAADRARARFESTGEVEYIRTISTEDETAAMYGPYDYYLNPERGAVPEWSADKFAVMSWRPWLEYDPRASAHDLAQPTLMVHSDGAVLPEYTRKYFDDIKATDKKLEWITTELDTPFHQFSFYDQEDEVSFVVERASRWFSSKM